MPTTYNNPELRQQLAAHLEACADNICDLQDRLMTGIATLKPIEYDRLLDEYRAAQIRYDRIDRELQALEVPNKTAAAKDMWRKRNKDNREKIKY